MRWGMGAMAKVFRVPNDYEFIYLSAVGRRLVNEFRRHYPHLCQPVEDLRVLLHHESGNRDWTRLVAFPQYRSEVSGKNSGPQQCGYGTFQNGVFGFLAVGQARVFARISEGIMNGNSEILIANDEQIIAKRKGSC